MKIEDEQILKDYLKKFDVYPPEPMGVPDDYYFKVLAAHTAKGEPVPVEFNWWPDKPSDAAI